MTMEIIGNKKIMLQVERAVIEIAGGCNYSCSMCPQTTGRGKDWTRKMSLSQFEDILQQLDGSPVINLEGSGEPTLAKDLPKYIELCKKYNFKSYMFTNAFLLSGDFMKDVVDAGIDLVRVSVIGYNRQKYKEWMSADNFDTIIENTIALKQYAKNTTVSSYHLILDNNEVDYEIEQYKKNFIDVTGTTAYIWKQHNWSGNWKPVYIRNSDTRKTCGRPFANEITIRSNGKVVPCCQTMGPPNEEKSILGDIKLNSLYDIYNGDLYNTLREKHSNKDFDSVDYCKNCDFLHDDPEVLVWTSDKTFKVKDILGTKIKLDYNENIICKS